MAPTTRHASARWRPLIASAPLACVALLVLTLAVVSPAGLIERRGGFRELPVAASDARRGVSLPDVFIVAGSDSVLIDGVGPTDFPDTEATRKDHLAIVDDSE